MFLQFLLLIKIIDGFVVIEGPLKDVKLYRSRVYDISK